MPRRAVRSALALPFVLAATVAAPSPASADDFQPFDADGYAFQAFPDAADIDRPGVAPTADGGYVTAVTTASPGELAPPPSRGIGECPPWLCAPEVRELVVTRLTADGRAVTSWGDGGSVRLEDLGGDVRAVRVLGDERIVVVGGGYDRGWAVWLDAAGATIDVQDLRGGEGCRYRDGAITSSGAVRAAFFCIDEESEGFWTTTRSFTAGGEPVAGIAVDDFWVSQIAIDGEDRLLLATEGDFRAGEGETVFRDVIRVRADGTRDEAFGTGGVAHLASVYRNPTALGVDGADRAILSFQSNSDGEWWFARLTEAGQLDPSFDGDGVVRVVDEELGSGAHALAGQGDGGIVATGYARGGTGNGSAVLRLNADGSVDRTFDESAAGAADGDGVHVLDRDLTDSTAGTPAAIPRGVVVPFSTEDLAGEARAATRAAGDAPAGSAVGLLRRALPAPPPPVEEEKKEEQKPVVQQQQSQTPPPVTVTAQSRTAKTLRSCLSRRSFTIRLRPKALRSATVKVAGKEVGVRRRNGRLTARVDLRKLEQATFEVQVVAVNAKGRTVRETRSYRTCRYGKNGPKVKGGSIITVVQS